MEVWNKIKETLVGLYGSAEKALLSLQKNRDRLVAVAPVLSKKGAGDEKEVRLALETIAPKVEEARSLDDLNELFDESDPLFDAEEDDPLFDEVEGDDEKPEEEQSAPTPVAKPTPKINGGKDKGQNVAQRLYHSMIGFGAKPEAAVAVIKGQAPKDPAAALQDDDEDLVIAEGVRWTALRIWDEAFETTRYVCKTKDNTEGNKRFQKAIVAIARGSHTLKSFHTGVDEYLQRPNPREIKDGASELADWQMDLQGFKIELESKKAANKPAEESEGAAEEATASDEDGELTNEQLAELAAVSNLGDDD